MIARWFALAWMLASQDSIQPQFGLSDLERATGWVSMSDEASRASWGAAVHGWTFEDSELRRAANTTEYFTWKDVLSDFEIEFEWRDHRAADNSWHPGRVVMRPDNSALALFAEQRIDRAADSDKPSFRAGPFELTPAQSKPGWHIALMPGESEFELRGMRVRDRSKSIGSSVELFDGKTLAGWRALGDAKFSVENRELIGEVGGGSQSFLCTEKTFGDFIFEVNVKNDLPGNSGIQVRSHENEQKRLFGYQIEIDPSPRAWSGGLYDEARRGWLDDLSDNPLGRAAFKNGEWNHYRIECIGPWIRAWVNDVPTSDYLDAKDLDGAIGLQVHAGKDTRVRWRNFKLIELGQSSWEFKADAEVKGCSIFWTEGDLHLRYQLPTTGSGQQVVAHETITLTVKDWSQTLTLESSTVAAGEILIFCHPPRISIELDGHQVPSSTWSMAPHKEDQTLHQVSVRWEGPWTIKPDQTLRVHPAHSLRFFPR